MRERAPVGGAEVKAIQGIPTCSAEASPGGINKMLSQGDFSDEARGIARSSSGLTARGRGFSGY
jgi:hypothetical protein